ncbi:hypothetical protein HYPSUDRAFT_332997 [Hypholoma sublateritium FD-334 SS-4]|uniref:Uncharacterized protein n=1 Tax=Hypholoma sublateritium (strain FD-334 SS-4) TaxID=945553 RepID=A0A0D2KMR3_HYPSF|nr:hypothetical protein HYPSUDRAFT_332997 [Hypholoma sublateritium FD-334 SS-4]
MIACSSEPQTTHSARTHCPKNGLLRSRVGLRTGQQSLISFIHDNSLLEFPRFGHECACDARNTKKRLFHEAETYCIWPKMQHVKRLLLPILYQDQCNMCGLTAWYFYQATITHGPDLVHCCGANVDFHLPRPSMASPSDTPKTIDCLSVPLLAFGACLTWMGALRGKYKYDRCLCVPICIEPQLNIRLPPSSSFTMAFGINIQLIPLTPDGRSRTEPPPDPESNKLKHINLEAYKRELIALRERDMAITSPTQPEYFARSRRPTVQIASPQPWPAYNDLDYDLAMLEQSFPEFNQYLFMSPTDTELDTCYYHDEALISEVNELVDVIYPNGLPSDFDSWEVYRQHPDPCVPEIAEDGEDAMCVDDDEISRTLAEFDRMFCGTATPPLEDEEAEEGASSPSPATTAASPIEP